MISNIRNFVIIAHVDHGKSTLADRFLELTGTVEKRKMQEQFLDTMELERERGITIKLQPVRMIYKIPNNKLQIPNKSQIQNSEYQNNLEIRNSKLEISDSEYILNLIDTPGHVDFTYEVSRSLAAVEGAILLVDATQGVQAQTLANLYLAQKQGLVIIPVINKVDLPNARVPETEEEIFNLIGETNILKVSAKTGEGVEKILKEVIRIIPPPDISTGPFRALIFDSSFDAYKGVVAYVRVFGGKVKSGDKFCLLAAKEKGEVIEVGYFLPKLEKSGEVNAGEIGYIATGIKVPGLVRVGDTISKNIEISKYRNIQPLPGYQEPLPVVFASFFPENTEQFDELKDALEKLKLTDASLMFEPESSPALGRGFRLGFLGLLHIEIISERLKREFGLGLIISSPTVEYEIFLKNGEAMKIRSAIQLPDPSFMEKIKEPVSRLDIITPLSYMGAVMKLVGELRSEYQETVYLTKEVVRLVYLVPLSEIITDFYDRLKSVSSGYASMSYEPMGHQEADLVRLDILVAGERVEPFSRIIPRNQAESIGRAMVGKLKGVIPTQLFAVALQAGVGGKIIARETIKARRKDVTGYLYGGDITRKKKLLEKQKRGKERMRETGRVNIPQNVFLEMLKK
ncbi:MAG: GTP-binding protein LepA [Parcubacteria group bacterium Gr01-1014_44]|nr:MAG: GTP-binding protein LepA [Parcubacteria group bacterium Gr01-1014_44]